jgi:predicted small metal-binding protein
MASFKCRSLGKKCRFEVQADTESEVLDAALEHMEKVHGGTVPPATIDKIKKAIER